MPVALGHSSVGSTHIRDAHGKVWDYRVRPLAVVLVFRQSQTTRGGMNWDAVAAVSEVVGAIAIVITLIYLAQQLRQNTKAIKSATWQATQDAEQRFDGMIASDSLMAELFDRGMEQGLGSVQKGERTRLWLIQKQLLDLYQTHHYHYENGIIDEDLWRNWVAQLDDGLSDFPNWGRDMVPRLKYLRPSFRAFLEHHLRKHDIEVGDEATRGFSRE